MLAEPQNQQKTTKVARLPDLDIWH